MGTSLHNKSNKCILSQLSAAGSQVETPVAVAGRELSTSLERCLALTHCLLAAGSVGRERQL